MRTSADGREYKRQMREGYLLMRGRRCTHRVLLIGLLLAMPAISLAAGRWRTSPAETRMISQLSRAERDIEYGRAGGQELKMDLYLPKEPAGAGTPVVMWLHGGAWKAGDKGWVPGLAALLEHGFAVASVNYRLVGEAIYPAQIEDCRAAVRYLKVHAAALGIDPSRIGVWGESAGGHLAALLGTTGNADPDARVQAVCDWYGPAELASLGFLSSLLQMRGGGDPVGDLLGGPSDQRAEMARAASPVAHVSPESAPFLIMHGNADVVVPLNQSQMLADALKKAGVDVDLVQVQGARHCDDRFLRPETIKRVISFFQKHLQSQAADASQTQNGQSSS